MRNWQTANGRTTIHAPVIRARRALGICSRYALDMHTVRSHSANVARSRAST